ncbi:uncharacterized protein LOC112494487 [Cephus cinctus]|uniref:Uncharacterized protein LOC112494487 n=1 Tax=Cephus cinctus TaxID=211228 RepID=A0AAJ7RIL4_CEPCN|nr:uncharacterized protein LOC112494487 [Cephus cinctus]
MGQHNLLIDYVASGRRISELDTFAEQLWYSDCDIPIPLRSLERESVYGLTSVLLIICEQCHIVHKVVTNKTPVREEDTGIQKYAVNYKVATAILDGGSGEVQINIILSVLNIPAMTSHFIKRYERTIDVAMEHVAKESCRDIIALNKKLTIEAREQEASVNSLSTNYNCML